MHKLTALTWWTKAAVHFVVLTQGTCILMCACIHARGTTFFINHVEWALYSFEDMVQLKYTKVGVNVCELFRYIKVGSNSLDFFP